MRFWVGIILPKKIYNEILKTQKKIAEKYETYHGLESSIGPHFTLTYQENIDEKDLKKIENIVHEISKEIKPFKVKIVDFRRFYKNRVIYARVIKSKKLNILHKKLSYKLSKFGKIRLLRGFTPHITIAYKDIIKENYRLAFKEFKRKKIYYEFKLKRIYIGKSKPTERTKVYKNFKL